MKARARVLWRTFRRSWRKSSSVTPSKVSWLIRFPANNPRGLSRRCCSASAGSIVNLARNVQNLTRDRARTSEGVDQGLAESLLGRAHRTEFQNAARAFDRDDSLGAMHRQA